MTLLAVSLVLNIEKVAEGALFEVDVLFKANLTSTEHRYVGSSHKELKRYQRQHWL